jgi:hypothetical protein
VLVASKVSGHEFGFITGLGEMLLWIIEDLLEVAVAEKLPVGLGPLGGEGLVVVGAGWGCTRAALPAGYL